MLSRLWLYEKSSNLYYKSYKTKKASDAIILLHGIGASSAYWPKDYSSISKSKSVYLVDLLGFGYSKKPKGEYTLESHVSALRKFISEEVSEKNIILIGHSLGAIIALAYAKKYPAHVKKTILLSLPYYSSEKEARAMIKSSRSFSFMFTDTHMSHFTCMLVCNARPFFRAVLPFFVRNLPKEVVKNSLLHTHESYFSTLRNVIFKQNIPLLLQNLKKKPILIHGENDKTASFLEAKKLASRYSLRFIAIPNEDHNFPMESPKKTLSLLAKILR